MTTSPPTAPDEAGLTTVAMLTLGCARNEVDSEELAGRLEAGGFRLVDEGGDVRCVGGNGLCELGMPSPTFSVKSTGSATRFGRRPLAVVMTAVMIAPLLTEIDSEARPSIAAVVTPAVTIAATLSVMTVTIAAPMHVRCRGVDRRRAL